MNKLTALCAAALAGMMMVSTVSAQERRFVTLEYLLDDGPMFSGQQHGQFIIVKDPPTPNGTEGKYILDVSNLFCLPSTNVIARYYSLYVEIENSRFGGPHHLLVFNTRCPGWGSYHGERFESAALLDEWLNPLNQIRVRIYKMEVGGGAPPIIPDPENNSPFVCPGLFTPGNCLVFEGTD